MKFAAVLIAAFMAFAFCLDKYELVNMINSNPDSKWTAKVYPKFESWTRQDWRNYLLDDVEVVGLPQVQHVGATVPTSYDARSTYPDCTALNTIRDQGQCGSCWAHGANEALSDRFCISSGGDINVTLSPEYSVSCDTGNDGCD
ncbi:cathepsin B, partial [Aduncisulcus paluster]